MGNSLGRNWKPRRVARRSRTHRNPTIPSTLESKNWIYLCIARPSSRPGVQWAFQDCLGEAQTERKRCPMSSRWNSRRFPPKLSLMVSDCLLEKKNPQLTQGPQQCPWRGFSPGFSLREEEPAADLQGCLFPRLCVYWWLICFSVCLLYGSFKISREGNHYT